MSNSMRELINKIDESQLNIVIDEGIFDILQKSLPFIDPIARARKHGAKEVNDIAQQSLKRFAQYVGRQNVDFSNATWNMLFRYLTMADQLALDPQEAKQIINDPQTQQQIKASLQKNKLPLPASNSWGKAASPIAGDPQHPKADTVSQLISAEILGLAAIKYLEKTTHASDLGNKQPGPQQPGPQQPGPQQPGPQQPGPQQPGPQQPGPQQPGPQAQANAAAINKLNQILQIIGSTP